MLIIEAEPAAECHPIPILDDGMIPSKWGSVILIDGNEYMRTMGGWADIYGDFLADRELCDLMDGPPPVVVYNPVPVRI